MLPSPTRAAPCPGSTTVIRPCGRSDFTAPPTPADRPHVHIRVDGWPNQQFALLFTDWLMANPGVRDDYLAAKRAALGAPDYADAKEPWFLDAYRRAWEWADTTGWRP